jgi:peptidoglycan hydrolase CwlO-like protein
MKVFGQRRGVTALKTIHTAGVRAIPKTQRSHYLELYTLGSEKGRLTKEMRALDARRQTINGHLKSINERIAMLQRDMKQEQQAEAGAQTPGQPIRTVDINY